MKKVSRTLAPIFLSLSFLSLNACQNDDKDEKGPRESAPLKEESLSLAGTVVSDARFSILKSALIQADLVKVLEEGEYTVFAPTDAAFQKIPAEQLNALLADKEKLTQVLLYHVQAGSLKASQVLEKTSLTSVSKESLAISIRDGKAFINDSQIIQTDILARNGVIHAIDTVLMPPTKDQQPAPIQANLVDLVIQDSRFSTLKEAVVAADLVDTLRNGNFTIFAPTNEAFAKIPTETLQAILADKAKLTDILLYHVVGGTQKAEAVLASSQLASALADESLSISLRDGGAFVNDSRIIATDILASNGVVHAIDTVLIPKKYSEPAPAPALANIVDIVIDNPNFQILERALTEAGLVDAVREGVLTVFAPTDAAFAKLPAGVLDSLLKDKAALTEVLLYHVVPGRVKAEAVLASASLETLSKGTLMPTLKDGKAFINDAEILSTDILASNGVVHVIGSVLVPKKAENPAPVQPNLVELVANNPQFSTLKAALIAADLIETVQSGTWTVFAPTNEAFSKIPAETLDALLNNKAALRQVLLYHVLAGKVTAETVLASSSLTTANNLMLKPSLNNGEAFINDSKILSTDIMASNGVVHVIDTVLIPVQRKK